MFAKEDFEEVGSPLSSCYGCGKPILDRFLLTVLEKEGHQFDSCTVSGTHKNLDNNI